MHNLTLICSNCNDAADPVTPYNGKTQLASTSHGEVIVALHKRCEQAWADQNECRLLVPLKKLHRRQPHRNVSYQAA